MSNDDWVEQYHRGKAETGKKYDPTQPRVPAGSPTGGQWTEGGGGYRVGSPRMGGQWIERAGFGQSSRGGPLGTYFGSRTVSVDEKITREYFTEGRGQEILADIPEGQKDTMIDVLADEKIPAGYIHRLKRISLNPPSSIGPSWTAGKWAYQFAEGFYDRAHRSIHIRPARRFFPETVKRVLSHELGHHITMDMNWRLQHSGTFKGAWDSQFSTGWKDEYSSMGLRKYSVTNFGEFMADSWAVYQLGKDEQRQALARALGVNSLDEAFFGG